MPAVQLEDFRGAGHTVRRIRDVAMRAQRSYEVRLLAEQIVGELGSKDYVSEILGVYYWLMGHARYANDPKSIELVRSPHEVLARLLSAVAQLRRGFRPSLDCDDLTALLVALLLVLGRDVRIVTVAFAHRFYRGERQYQHVFVTVKEPRTGRWIVLDPVAAEDTPSMLRRVRAAKIWAVA